MNLLYKIRIDAKLLICSVAYIVTLYTFFFLLQMKGYRHLLWHLLLSHFCELYLYAITLYNIFTCLSVFSLLQWSSLSRRFLSQRVDGCFLLGREEAQENTRRFVQVKCRWQSKSWCDALERWHLSRALSKLTSIIKMIYKWWYQNSLESTIFFSSQILTLKSYTIWPVSVSSILTNIIVDSFLRRL